MYVTIVKRFLAAINKLKYLYFQITKIRDNTIQSVSTKLNQTQMKKTEFCNLSRFTLKNMMILSNPS